MTNIVDNVASGLLQSVEYVICLAATVIFFLCIF